MNLSKTEQDYLKSIYELSLQTEETLVSLKDLTAKLGVSAPTVTEMAKRIEKKDLVVYQSYKGVSLTEKGKREALFILKAHRVWEYFLLDVLHYQEEDVHAEAEALEHAVSPQLIERLYDYIGKPETCPHGKPIPQEVFWYEAKKEIALSALAAGIRAEIIQSPKALQEYLQKLEINDDVRFIKIIDILADGTQLIELDNGTEIVLPPFFQKDVVVVIYE